MATPEPWDMPGYDSKVIMAAAQRGIEINEYTPLQVKQAVVGYGLSLIHI